VLVDLLHWFVHSDILAPKMAEQRRTDTAKRDLTARLIAGFKDLISDHGLQSGAKLPPERVLAEEFQVSRQSLRQALKALETMGILSQRVGDGTYFSTTPSAMLGEPMDFLMRLGAISMEELFELRLIVEPVLANRAAQRATAADLAALRSCISTMRQSASDPVAFLHQDVIFHDLIFQASGNRACRMLFTMIFRATLTSFATLPLMPGRVLASHRAICSAIARRRGREAAALMEKHIQHAQSVLKDTMARQSKTDLRGRIRPMRRGQGRNVTRHDG